MRLYTARDLASWSPYPIYLDENRNTVRLKEISRVARKSVLGIEDYRFYQHGGVDPKAILRAFVENLRAGHAEQPGRSGDRL